MQPVNSLKIDGAEHLFWKSVVHNLYEHEEDKLIESMKPGDYFIEEYPDASYELIYKLQNGVGRHRFTIENDRVNFDEVEVKNFEDFNAFLKDSGFVNLIGSLEYELKNNSFEMGVISSDQILAIHEKGTCLIRKVGNGYILDLVTAPNEVKHIVFSIEDHAIKDEANRSYAGLGYFFQDVGATAFLTPSKDT